MWKGQILIIDDIDENHQPGYQAPLEYPHICQAHKLVALMTKPIALF